MLLVLLALLLFLESILLCFPIVLLVFLFPVQDRKKGFEFHLRIFYNFNLKLFRIALSSFSSSSFSNSSSSSSSSLVRSLQDFSCWLQRQEMRPSNRPRWWLTVKFITSHFSLPSPFLPPEETLMLSTRAHTHTENKAKFTSHCFPFLVFLSFFLPDMGKTETPVEVIRPEKKRNPVAAAAAPATDHQSRSLSLLVVVP